MLLSTVHSCYCDKPLCSKLVTVEQGSFSFNTTATTEIYTLSLHDALPIYLTAPGMILHAEQQAGGPEESPAHLQIPAIVDRKSTRLNSSHRCTSYAVFCLKKKKILQTRKRSKTIVGMQSRKNQMAGLRGPE